jgi:hypothetical protein
MTTNPSGAEPMAAAFAPLRPWMKPRIGFVVLAHTDPFQVGRLVRSLAPAPVVVHCDLRTDAGTWRSMQNAVEGAHQLLPRVRAGWGSWGNVEAELSGFRALLQVEDVTHCVTLTGSDFPLWTVPDLELYLESLSGSIFDMRELPSPGWGKSGGFSRYNYRHWVWRKHMIRLPVRRELPADITPCGGSQLKILCREHIEEVLRLVRERPDLTAFWRRVWVPDETFIPSMLGSPQLCRSQAPIVRQNRWFMDWGSGRSTKSPRWLTLGQHYELLRRAMASNDQTRPWFARKFDSENSLNLLHKLRPDVVSL